ncbi:MAG: hypothetical protein Q7W02_24445 [Candidatus Rokubacteria bacterium]|nr:hypothetical protein [Candidatus Rokubacteria bacterium]
MESVYGENYVKLDKGRSGYTTKIVATLTRTRLNWRARSDFD